MTTILVAPAAAVTTVLFAPAAAAMTVLVAPVAAAVTVLVAPDEPEVAWVQIFSPEVAEGRFALLSAVWNQLDEPAAVEDAL